MAKFCTNCGRPLKKDEVCDCVKVEANNEDMKENIIEVVKGMFTAPADTMETYVNENHFVMAMILAGIASISTGLAMVALVKNALSLIMSSLGVGMGVFSMSGVEIPYMRIFIIGAILAFIISFGYAGVLYLVNAFIFKRDASYKKVYTLYGIASVLMTATLLATSICVFVNVTLGILVLLLGAILNFVYTYQGIQYLGEEDANKYGYIYLATTVVWYIVIYVVLKLFS